MRKRVRRYPQPWRIQPAACVGQPFHVYRLMWANWEAEAATWEARLHAMQTGENQARGFFFFAPDSGVCRPLWDGTGACSGPPSVGVQAGLRCPLALVGWQRIGESVLSTPRGVEEYCWILVLFFCYFPSLYALRTPTYPCSVYLGSARLVYRWRVARPRRWQLL